MEQQQQEKVPEKDNTRKRKLKFSEREQETLIEELVPHHDELFGRTSHRVPEASKRKIWLHIQEKVNAVGVTHRTIKDLTKRWYDMRQRSKEKIAERLKEAGRTGGGASTSTNPTPHEQLVEDTLLPESVVGVSNMDSSAPTDPKQAPQHRQEQEEDTEEEGEMREDNEEQGPTENTGPGRHMAKRRRRHVSPLPQLEADAHDQPVEEEEQQEETVQQVRQGHPGQDTQSHRVPGHRHRAGAGHGHHHGDECSIFSSLERSMITTQRLQHKVMRSINRQLNTLNRNIINMDVNNTRAMDRLCHALRAVEASRHRATQHHHAHLATYTMAVNRLCATTSALSRRSASIQGAMLHCCQDVARGLAQVTTAVEHLQTASAGGDVLLRGGEDEDDTSRSSITPPVPTVRRRSQRQVSNMGGSMEESEQPVRPRGGRGNRH